MELETILTKTFESKSAKTIRNFDNSHYGIYLASGLINHPDNSAVKRIGRLVQVREEAGAFGSNQVFLRGSDNKLQLHENQFFVIIPDELIPEVEKHFTETHKDNPEVDEYGYMDDHYKKGFIIKSEIKPGETTPLRELKAAITEKIIAYKESKK